MNIARQWWQAARPREREELRGLYSRIFSLDPSIAEAVQYAHILEILEAHDYRTWPEEYMLSGVNWSLQGLLMNNFEQNFVDHFQRANYLRLVMAEKDRHKDVAYGLSQKMLWREKDSVIEKLLSMGTRTYRGAIPESHQMDNGVLHVAISYKHTGKYDRGGTISLTQAEAIWSAVTCIPLVSSDTEVRVWIDQNLHRTKFHAKTEWHEFGLLPYACLMTVFVGDGDFSLRYANERPWLWVELLTALKGHGVHTMPDCDVVEDCGGVLSKGEHYDGFGRAALKFGWVVGSCMNVDATMAEMARIVSLWRRENFLSHKDYEYAPEFELFVNWARRFVLRGVNYSEMAWNNGSKAVQGMDAVVLLRALPKSYNMLDLLRLNISWRQESRSGAWVLGDLIDRSLVGALRIDTLMETKEEASSEYEDLTITGKQNGFEKLTLRRMKGSVSMVETREGNLEGMVTNFSKALFTFRDEYEKSANSVTLTSAEFEQSFITYMPFTRRMSIAKGEGGLALKDSEVNPLVIRVNVEDELRLRKIGICYNVGLCEQVYSVEIAGKPFMMSTTEIHAVHEACNEDVSAFNIVAMALKKSCSYKWMRYQDLSESEKIDLTRGWRVQGVEGLRNHKFISGEIDTDVGEELIDMLRTQNSNSTLVWIDNLDRKKVQVVFRGRNYISRIITEALGASRELAILEEKVAERLIDSEATGLVQMAAGVAPKCKIKAYGSGLNPAISGDVTGRELNVEIVSGLFSACVNCNSVVCTINGLVASISLRNSRYQVEWKGSHECRRLEYRPYSVIDGLRLV